jgi:F-type H+-transporting ATPase subunit a
MEELTKITSASINLFGHIITFNPNVFYMTWLVMALIIIVLFLSTRKLTVIPHKSQNIVEVVVDFIKNITYSTLGKEDGKKFFPFIMTLFLFILISNWIGIVPNFIHFIGVLFAGAHKLLGSENVKITYEGLTYIKLYPDPNAWYAFFFKFPKIEEPTKFLSTDLAAALLVFLVGHASAIKEKGLLAYFKGYMDPVPSHAPWIFFFFLNPFFYLNIIGELGKVVSHSVRLFGNVFGGGIIIFIVATLLRHVLLPVGLYAFFGLLAGSIQAFVFTMLAVTYISLAK